MESQVRAAIGQIAQDDGLIRAAVQVSASGYDDLAVMLQGYTARTLIEPRIDDLLHDSGVVEFRVQCPIGAIAHQHDSAHAPRRRKFIHIRQRLRIREVPRECLLRPLIHPRGRLDGRKIAILREPFQRVGSHGFRGARGGAEQCEERGAKHGLIGVGSLDFLPAQIFEDGAFVGVAGAGEAEEIHVLPARERGAFVVVEIRGGQTERHQPSFASPNFTRVL